jgi:membrane protein
VGELQDSLNTIWNVKARPKASLLTIVRTRFTSFAMVLAIGFLLLVSLILSTILSALTRYAGQRVTALDTSVPVLDLGLSFAVITVLFALLYKVLPDARIRWRDVWVGAATASLLFAVGKFGLSYYLSRGSVASTFGAAGSLVVLLLWVYYSAQIFLFGAELTQVATTSRRAVAAEPGATKTDRPEKRNPLRARPHAPGRA